jgi:hypothetical protein
MNNHASIVGAVQYSPGVLGAVYIITYPLSFSASVSVSERGCCGAASKFSTKNFQQSGRPVRSFFQKETSSNLGTFIL